MTASGFVCSFRYWGGRPPEHVHLQSSVSRTSKPPLGNGLHCNPHSPAAWPLHTLPLPTNRPGSSRSARAVLLGGSGVASPEIGSPVAVSSTGPAGGLPKVCASGTDRADINSSSSTAHTAVFSARAGGGGGGACAEAGRSESRPLVPPASELLSLAGVRGEIWARTGRNWGRARAGTGVVLAACRKR